MEHDAATEAWNVESIRESFNQSGRGILDLFADELVAIGSVIGVPAHVQPQQPQGTDDYHVFPDQAAAQLEGVWHTP